MLSIPLTCVEVIQTAWTHVPIQEDAAAEPRRFTDGRWKPRVEGVHRVRRLEGVAAGDALAVFTPSTQLESA